MPVEGNIIIKNARVNNLKNITVEKTLRWRFPVTGWLWLPA